MSNPLHGLPSLATFAIALLLLHSAAAQSRPAPPVSHGDNWHYGKGPSEPPADWRTVPDATLDGSWLIGAGGFGYGDGDDATELTDMENGYSPIPIRNSFEARPGMARLVLVQLAVGYDDDMGGVSRGRTDWYAA